MTILVTGGAGYIGSHVVRQLGERQEKVVVLDNLSTGFRSAVLHGELVVGDTGDRELVSRVLREHRIETVMHFAANTIVPESVANPLKYYSNNTCSTRNLLQGCQEAGVKHFVFSSTAAVYGIPEGGIASEDSPTQPINPYGTSKLMSEWMLRDLAAATRCATWCCVTSMSPVAIRASASVSRRSRRRCSPRWRPKPPSANVPRFRFSAPTIRPPTAPACATTSTSKTWRSAHLKALDYLRADGTSVTLNCGYGHGYSVREVISTMNRADRPAAEDRRRATPGRRPAVAHRQGAARPRMCWAGFRSTMTSRPSSARSWSGNAGCNRNPACRRTNDQTTRLGRWLKPA